MAMNRVQFQPGLSMAEFMARYGSEELCESALVEARWPKGFACPVCGSSTHTSFLRERRRYWQCSRCRHQCSVISGTIWRLITSTWSIDNAMSSSVACCPSVWAAIRRL